MLNENSDYNGSFSCKIIVDNCLPERSMRVVHNDSVKIYKGNNKMIKHVII